MLVRHQARDIWQFAVRVCTDLSALALALAPASIGTNLSKVKAAEDNLLPLDIPSLRSSAAHHMIFMIEMVNVQL